MNSAIIYWTSTGNTEQMAQAILEGAPAGTAYLTFSETTPADALKYDALVLGCSAMGCEELDSSEVEPFFEELEKGLSGKSVALFGSYGWGDGEWMRTWYARAQAAGAVMLQDEGLIANEEPDDDVLAACKALGASLA